MPEVIYVTGGARSGKSSYALNLALKYSSRVFLATAEPFDEEMRRRIEKHRDERHEEFITIEEPLHLDRALRSLPRGCEVVLIDCLTVWLGNLMYKIGDEERRAAGIEALLDVLRDPPCDIILVSNEVGMGIVPDNALARSFRDLAGTLNRRVATLADKAFLLCSGLALELKSKN